MHLFGSFVAQLAQLYQVLRFGFEPLRVGALFIAVLLFANLEVLLSLSEYFKAVRASSPLAPLCELVNSAATPGIVTDNAPVNVDVVYAERTNFLHALIDVFVFRLYCTVGLQTLWSRFLRTKVVLSFEALEALHRVFKFKLNFAIVWCEFQANFVDELAGHCEVRPAIEDLVAFVLETELPPPIEFGYHLLNHRWVALVANVLQ